MIVMKRLTAVLILALSMLLSAQAFSRDMHSAQTPDSLGIYRDSIVYVPAPYCDSSLVGCNIFSILPGVSITQDVAVRTAMYEHVRENASREIQGYRIRIFFDNRQSAREDSERVAKEFAMQFPGLLVYRSYVNPYFKVTVGDFRTRSEAMAALAEIKKMFPSAFLVKEKISYPALDRRNPVVRDTVRVRVRDAETSSGLSAPSFTDSSPDLPPSVS